jgi:hypothetical protein
MAIINLFIFIIKNRNKMVYVQTYTHIICIFIYIYKTHKYDIEKSIKLIKNKVKL